MSRIENTGKNIVFSTGATITSSLMGFVGRIVFMNVLGAEYLGISALFTSVITVLSFVDLGLISAFTFCFYKPIEQNDTKYIQVLLNTLKKVLTAISLVVTALGLCAIPFLRFVVSGADNITSSQLIVYYLLTLSTTIISYWLAYRTCYINAKQEYHKIVPINMICNFVLVILQIAVLLITQNYVAWGVTNIVMAIVQKIAVDLYIKKLYPFTKEKVSEKIKDKDKKSIVLNVKGLLVHNLATVFVHQTDNIIVSTFVSITVTGLLSNYTLIRETIFALVGSIRTAIIASMGSLIASEDEEVQLNVFYTYLFINYCLIGFIVCALGVLSTPFIALVFGESNTIDGITVFLMCISYFIAYQTYALITLPTAGGKFILGVGAAITEAVSNLVISIIAVNLIGLPGIFLGTLLSQTINFVIRPFSIFKGMYNQKPYKYFKYTLLYLASTLFSYTILLYLRSIIMADGANVFNFIVMMFLTPTCFLGTAFLFWQKNKYARESFAIMLNYAKSILKIAPKK